MAMFAVLAEDRSDVDSLVVLIKRIRGVENATILKKGFSGCGELCRKAGSHVRDFAEKGATHFIVCHDSDGNPPAEVRKKVRESIAARTAVPEDCCIVVPVQELEAWIIADEEAIKKAIPSLSIKPVARPETVPSPKEWLVDESRRGRSRPLYVPTIHNAKVAAHLDLKKVEKKCPSFSDLVAFVGGTS
ncbi:hypothetical protein OJF2_77840 [Aquisphaera giovannonii]|uniref:DUF4276 domain-containing protein n=1 Tax=Aquisphaera giovannonii TaxID=406548 RepID=A0A5B9WF12_9BACT|nr:DUF4276 family protein [Aquisphaera giovannonii]QEH39172.1 hypothetical protein OJF2_77840 [Aquisphaera giovannonii]